MCDIWCFVVGVCISIVDDSLDGVIVLNSVREVFDDEGVNIFVMIIIVCLVIESV